MLFLKNTTTGKLSLIDESDESNQKTMDQNPKTMDQNAKIMDQNPKKDEQPTIFFRKVSEDAYMKFWGVVWMIVIGSFAAFVEFWLPDINIGVINLSNTLKNGIGSFVIGIVSTFEIIKFQYPQTYLVYNAIGGAFCSVMTTFGNIIEDTERLIYYYNFYPAPLYLIGNLIFSFLLHELGVLFAKKWKSGARFADTLNSLDNSDQRLMFEIENKGFKSKIRKQNNLKEISTEKQTLMSGSETNQIGGVNHRANQKRKGLNSNSGHDDDDNNKLVNRPLLEQSEEFQEGNHPNKSNEKSNTEKLTVYDIHEINENQLTNDFEVVDEENSVVYYKDKRLDELSKHLQIQFLKKQRHNTIFLTKRHIFALVIMILCVILNFFLVKMPLFYPISDITTPDELQFYYHVMLFLNVFGAFAGGWISGDRNKKFDIQWGTFRNNMVSVILIATAHNILVLEGIFHVNKKMEIFLLSFISDYCGSESNWAGLINETAILYQDNLF
ncbi:fluoride export protein 1-related [Anaeramoeba flamelloides]|uniref:Fluoride export protein 1-related n=1 Tax=Anaeramoeba flamelloides TaxID=1746091 RepID=A0AAV7ZCF5_9EUKA|nr:fluoride export protein 1-related [Anaeramoeba flamelloides]